MSSWPTWATRWVPGQPGLKWDPASTKENKTPSQIFPAELSFKDASLIKASVSRNRVFKRARHFPSYLSAWPLELISLSITTCNFWCFYNDETNHLISSKCPPTPSQLMRIFATLPTLKGTFLSPTAQLASPLSLPKWHHQMFQSRFVFPDLFPWLCPCWFVQVVSWLAIHTSQRTQQCSVSPHISYESSKSKSPFWCWVFVFAALETEFRAL